MADYLMPGGTIVTNDGVFYDTGGPAGQYSNNQDITTTFTSADGYPLRFTFTAFATEAGYDYLRIYDGTSTGAALIGSFAGTVSPGVITATGSSLTFRFTSDSSVIGDGWAATISTVPPPFFPAIPGPEHEGATIVFAPLVGGSPESSATSASVVLPVIAVYGQEASGGYGVLDTPPLTVVATGTVTVRVDGTGAATLPLFDAFGLQAAGGYGVATLPALTTYGTPRGMFAPQAGSGAFDLPALTTAGSGYRALNSDVSLELRPLFAYGQQQAGGYGIIELPRLATVGAEMPASLNFFYMVQSAGYLQAFASTSQYMTMGALGAVADVTSDIKDVLVIQSALSAALVQGNQLRAHPDIALSGALSDALGLAYGLLVAQAATGDVSGELTRQHSLVVADTLTATLAVDSRQRALLTVALASVLRDAIAIGTPLDVAFAGTLADAVEAKLAQLLTVEAAGIGDVTADHTLRLSLVVEDTGVAALDVASAVRAFFDADLNGLMYVSLRFGAGDYSGWVMNTETLAPSEYQNYPFDGFASYNGKDYGFGPGGTVRFDGGTDAGEPIPAWLRTFFMDFGSSTEKRVSDVYVGATNAGQLVVKAVSYHRGTGQKFEDWYAVKSLPGTGVAEGRAQIGQGLRSTWWQFELHNVAGSDFEIEEIAFRPILIDRRV